MNKILLALLVLTSTNIYAQKISVEKGQKISIMTNADQDIDMSGMGMQMKNKSTMTSVVEINDISKDNIEADYTLKKIKVSMDMMGQENHYDSENPEDKDSEMGKTLAGSIGKKIKINIDKTSGHATLEDKDDAVAEKDDNPLLGIMNSLGSGDEDATVQSMFFVIPPSKKIGDSWTDSSSTGGMKEVKKFTLKSIANNIATIGLESNLSGNSTIENQGMQMDIKIISLSKGDIILNTKTSMVQKRSTNVDLTGSIEIMGQSMPVTSKATITVDYQ